MKLRFGFALGIALWASLGCSLPLWAAGSPYEMEYTNEKPLIVIRFNQPHVPYERPLYTTISRALQVKPSAMFDVVSVTPRARSTQNQQNNNQLASRNTSKVLGTLQEMGLPQSRINLTNAMDDISTSEVRIFVR